MASYDLGLFKGHGLGDVGAVGNGFQEHERVSTLADKIAKHLTAIDKSQVIAIKQSATNTAAMIIETIFLALLIQFTPLSNSSSKMIMYL